VPRLLLALTLLLVASVVAEAQIGYRGVSIPTRDGKALAADLYSTDTTVRRPTILIQTPYNKNVYRLMVNIPREAGGGPFPIDTAHYNYVVVDWRGFHGSRDASVTGYDRGLDGYDVVEWIATQSWSDGKVGTWGPSALGLVQFQAAEHHPPHLVCAVPLVKDFKTKYTDFYYGGEFRKEHVESLESLGLASTALILSRPTNDNAWAIAERNTDIADEIAIPMLLISGWYDHYPDDVIRAFDDLRARSAASVRTQHKLIMGPWLHERIGVAEQGALTYPNAEGVSDSAALAFFDRYLRGLDNGYESQPTVRYYQMGDDEWRSTASWHALARETDTLRLYLRGGPADATLLPDPEEGEAIALLRYDPRDPSPTVGGARLVPFGDDVPVGPQDQRAVEERDDAIVLETRVLADDLAVTGAPYLELFVECGREDSDIAVRLCDVYPDGRSMLVTQGIQRLRFRNGLRPQDTALVPLGETVRVRVGLQNLAMTWRAGHRLRLIVTGSNYPQFERNLNVTSPLYGGGDTLIATTQIFGRPDRPTHLMLPIAAGTSRVDVENQAGSPVSLPSRLAGIVPVRFVMTERAAVSITLHDMLGRTIVNVLDDEREAGRHEVGFDADGLAEGSYLLRVVIAGRAISRLVVR
jgi:uncharacterized protein